MVKLTSRKFLVFLVWTILSIFLVINSSDLTSFLPWYGIISTIYIGGESTIDAVERLKQKR